MITYIEHKRNSLTYRMLSAFIAMTFIFSMVVPPQASYAQMVPQTVLNLPIPGTMVPMTSVFAPTLIKGITIHPDNPLMFDFIVDNGDENLTGEELKKISKKLIKYFLASLTVPEDDQWVNLSPYEQDRIIPEGFGDTEMGRDLLAMDYMLKQLTSSLMYPEDELGKKFWKRVYEKAYEKYGTTEIPVNTFNKVWIVPESAKVYEHENSAFIVESHLKVMLEEDYLALQENLDNARFGLDQVEQSDAEVISGVSSEIVREILIPEIEKEVNQGETFANLRQIYNSMILAAWYKLNLKESLLGQVYMNQNKTAGVDTEDKQVNQKIYDQYVQAFSMGVYNYIREDYDEATSQIIPRKYFSGGFWLGKNILGIVAAGLMTLSVLPKNVEAAMDPQQDGIFNIGAQVIEKTGNKVGKEKGQLDFIIQKTEGSVTLKPMVAAVASSVNVMKKRKSENIMTREQPVMASSVVRLDRNILEGFQKIGSDGVEGVSTIARRFGDSYENIVSIVPFFVEQVNRDVEKENQKKAEQRKKLEQLQGHNNLNESEIEEREELLKLEKKGKLKDGKFVTEQEVFKEVNDDTYSEIFPLVKRIDEMIANKEIFPDDVDLSMSIYDGKERMPFRVGKGENERDPNILFWPLKGDPWQVGHIWMLLKAVVEHKIDRIVIMVDNSDPERKPDLSSLVIRDPLSAFIFKNYLKGLVQYTTLPKEMPKLFGADGETVIFQWLRLNKNQPMNVFYGGGTDHLFLYSLRKAALKQADFLKANIDRLNNGARRTLMAQLKRRDFLNEDESRLDEDVYDRLIEHLKEKEYLVEVETREGMKFFPNEKKFNEGGFGEHGNPEDMDEADLESIGEWNTPELKAFVYRAFFAPDVPTKIANGIIKNVREAMDSAADKIEETVRILKNHRLNIFFAERPGAEIKEELLAKYEQRLVEYMEHNAKEIFEEFNMDIPTIGVTKASQPMDASSSDVRKKGHYWKVPWENLQIAYGFGIWGYQTDEVDQEQAQKAEALIRKLKKYLKEPDEVIRRVMRQGEDGQGGMQKDIQALVGEGIIILDKFIIAEMKENKSEEARLVRKGGEFVAVDQRVLGDEYRRLERFRNLLFERSNQIIQEALKNPLPIRKKDQVFFSQMVREDKIDISPFTVQYFQENRETAQVTAKKFDVSEDMVKAVLERLVRQGIEVASSSPAKSTPLGGINLDPKLLDLQIKRDGNGVPLPVWDQPIDQMHIEGFVPVIIHIEMIPFSQMPMLLGLSGSEEVPVNSANDAGKKFFEAWPDTAWLLGEREQFAIIES